MKKKKGEPGYLTAQKKRIAVRTVLLFALALAIYLTGYFSTGSNQNLLTIVAVLGCLPASRSAVSLFATLRFHGIGQADLEQIRAHTKHLPTLCDLAFTTYEKNYEIHHMACLGKTLVGYTSHAGCDTAGCEAHLKSMCVQNGLKGVEIKIFRDLPKYLGRLDTLERLAQENNTEKRESGQDTDRELTERLFSLLCAISL